MQVLLLTSQGRPSSWISWQDAVAYYAKGKVSFELGTEFMQVNGGRNKDGLQSEILVSSIIGVRSPDKIHRPRRVPRNPSKPALLHRDRYLCAYCGSIFGKEKLEAEHILPRSRGGDRSWMNLVTACKRCNSHKDNRTPEEAGMSLLYLPYVPNEYEAMILAGRKILVDQMEFLMAGIPAHSRLKPG